MNYATIKYYDIANGPGVRTSVFVSGCRHHCPGCFNEVAWDFGYGQPFDKPVRNEVFASCKPDYITGLSLLGGEPMEPANQRGLIGFLRRFREKFGATRTLWVYTGCVLELDLLPTSGDAIGFEYSTPHRYWRTEVTDEILSMVDVLVDGPFVEELKDISLQFRGSSNQRILKLHG